MFKRPTPKTFTSEESASLQATFQNQSTVIVRPKSYDDKFPAFETPVNQKLLVYIPNHRVQDANGMDSLVCDRYAAHPYTKGREYGYIRCSNGVVSPSIGLDGTCPLCDASSDIWKLYNYQYEQIAKQKGIDKDSAEAKEGLKSERSNLLNSRAIKEASIFYTFPIVVIACEEKDGQLTVIPKKNEKGEISGKTYWYTCSEKAWHDSWMSGLDNAPGSENGELTCFAGQWAILDYTYQSTSGEYNKRDSARNLKVKYKKMSDDYKAWETYFDNMTAEWTPMKAWETLVNNAIRSMDEMKEVADELITPVRQQIGMFEIGQAQAAEGIGTTAQNEQAAIGTAEAALQSFGATNAGTATAPAGGVSTPPVGNFGEVNAGVQA